MLQDGFQLSLMDDLPSEGTRTCSYALVPSSPWGPPKKRSSGSAPSLASQASHWTPVGVGVKGFSFYKIGHGFCFLSTCYVLGPMQRAWHTLAHWLLTKVSEVGIILPILKLGNREVDNLPKVTKLITNWDGIQICMFNHRPDVVNTAAFIAEWIERKLLWSTPLMRTAG